MAQIKVWRFPSVEDRERNENGVVVGFARTLNELDELINKALEMGGAIGYSQRGKWIYIEDAMSRLRYRKVGRSLVERVLSILKTR